MDADVKVPPKTDIEVFALIARRYGAHLLFLHRLYDLGPATIGQCTPHLQGLSVPHPRLLAVFMLNRAITALGSVTSLFSQGMDTDAMSVGRTITELLIDYAWIFQTDTAARTERYLDYNTVMVHQIRYAIGSGLNVMPEQQWLLDQLDTDFAAVMKKHAFQKGRWAPNSIQKRAEQTGLTVLYDVFYVHGCNASHSSALSLLEYAQNGVIWHGARVPAMSLALQVAAKSFLMLVERVVDEFKVSRNAYDAFETEHLAVFSIP